MATIRELLEQRLARVSERHGPDSESAKDLKAQIASLGTVRHPSQLAVLNSKKSDSYHGAVLDSAPADPMLPAMDGLEEAMLKQAEAFRTTGKPPLAPSPQSADTTQPSNAKG